MIECSGSESLPIVLRWVSEACRAKWQQRVELLVFDDESGAPGVAVKGVSQTLDSARGCGKVEGRHGLHAPARELTSKVDIESGDT